MREKEVISPAAFNELLDWLHPDRDEAGKRYETIRTGLIRMFDGRGCIDAENLADVTIDRVSTLVKNIRDSYIGDPESYFHGVARNIFLEYLKARPEINFEPVVAEELIEDVDPQRESLEKCLEELGKGQREMILEYFTDSKSAKIERHRTQATELGMKSGSLRTKIHRIRQILEKCMEKSFFLKER
jgi:DNA-directed RNA polymerase specialized sigma24 family protein